MKISKRQHRGLRSPQGQEHQRVRNCKRTLLRRTVEREKHLRTTICEQREEKESALKKVVEFEAAMQEQQKQIDNMHEDMEKQEEKIAAMEVVVREQATEVCKKEHLLAAASQKIQELEKELVRKESWLRDVLSDGERKALLIEQLQREQQKLRLRTTKPSIEWISEKLKLLRRLEDAVKQVEMLRTENEALRGFISEQHLAEVVVLPPQQSCRLHHLRDGSVDPKVLDDARWRKATTDTIYIWGSGDDAGGIAFAVFFRPPEVMSQEATFLAIFQHIDKFRYPLHRHKLPEWGKVWGVGFRAGYDEGQSYGTYRVPSRGGISGAERALFPENRQIEEMGGHVATILETMFCRRLPSEFEEKAQIVETEGIPTLGDSDSTPHLIPTEGYYVCEHMDTDLGCADGVWWEKHGPRCRRRDHNRSCCKRWAFLFPEYDIQVPIRNGTCIMWQGTKVYHLTVFKRHRRACNGHKAYSIVTQIKRSLMYRVRAQRMREI